MACQDPPGRVPEFENSLFSDIFTAQDTPLSVAAALAEECERFCKRNDIPFIFGSSHLRFGDPHSNK